MVPALNNDSLTTTSRQGMKEWLQKKDNIHDLLTAKVFHPERGKALNSSSSKNSLSARQNEPQFFIDRTSLSRNGGFRQNVGRGHSEWAPYMESGRKETTTHWIRSRFRSRVREKPRATSGSAGPGYPPVKGRT